MVIYVHSQCKWCTEAQANSHHLVQRRHTTRKGVSEQHLYYDSACYSSQIWLCIRFTSVNWNRFFPHDHIHLWCKCPFFEKQAPWVCSQRKKTHTLQICIFLSCVAASVKQWTCTAFYERAARRGLATEGWSLSNIYYQHCNSGRLAGWSDGAGTFKEGNKFIYFAPFVLYTTL